MRYLLKINDNNSIALEFHYYFIFYSDPKGNFYTT